MTNPNITKRTNRIRRHARGRARISGTSERPRVVVFKSNAHMYVQAIDDDANKTIAAVSDLPAGKAGAKLAKKGTKTDHASAVGTKLAELLKKKNVTVVVFDKGGFKYHGRVKAVAEALRVEGITV